jgi:hypothetical protein
MLRIVFLHFHAKPSGVTRVIQQQMDALKDDAECIFIAGNNGNGETLGEEWGLRRVRIVAGVGYDGIRPEETAESTVSQILKVIESQWPSGCDLIHVHNPLLNKNRDFLAMLKILQNKGIPLFLQIHDTAEDFRPGSYYSREEYPANCHYGVINSRDYNLFLQAGLKHEGLHFLPNCVTPLVSLVQKQKEVGRDHYRSPLVLYPVRAIRRKNIGEAILLSCFFPPSVRLGITLPPSSPADYPSYEGWKAFSLRESLPVDFELGLVRPLSDWIPETLCMISTSIREGFGFTFLEPWTAGRGLIGRRIPPVIEDFQRLGIEFPDLYDHLFIPTDWIPLEEAKARWVGVVRETYAQYNLPLDPTMLETVWNRISGGGKIDFPYLHPLIAQRFIRQCRGSSKLRERLVELNPFLATFVEKVETAESSELIESNRARVLSAYSLETYRERLLTVYHKVLNISAHHSIDKKTLLQSFLDPTFFYLGGM